jgi:hypothetical protein
MSSPSGLPLGAHDTYRAMSNGSGTDAACPAAPCWCGAITGSARLLPLHDGHPDVDYEADIEIMELAHALRITPNSLATAVPYFHVTSAPRISTRFSVGVLAQAGSWDATRSIPADSTSRYWVSTGQPS